MCLPRTSLKWLLGSTPGWGDVPSNWAPAPLEQQAQELVGLIGLERVIERAQRLMQEGDAAMAPHLIDWAFYAAPIIPRCLKQP
ncbi:MAG: hypothetical protein AAF512_01525 [Pseudomonadota bacterium]